MEASSAHWPASLWATNAIQWQFDPLPSHVSCDVAIIGAGFTGLWTAHHLLSLNPTLSIIIVDAQQPGFGASGRNGGWCSALSPMSLAEISQRTGRETAIALQAALVDTVSHIGDFIETNHIQCGWRHTGTLSFARNSSQLHRLNADISSYRKFGFGEDFVALLSAQQSDDHVRIHKALGASFTPHCATLHPRQLVDGLVANLINRGVQIFGNSRVTEIKKNLISVQTPSDKFDITCHWSARATEAYTASIRKMKRAVAPVYSYMIATEPLTSAQWDEIGWSNGETWTDGRRMIVYAQKTHDGRIAFGGRGAPYKFASRVGGAGDTNIHIHQNLEMSLHDLLPSTTDVRISHRWGGSLGIHRDWNVAVEVDHQTQKASAGGYVGDGVAFSYLAARSLANEILQTEDASRTLPFVHHHSPKWEPEPLRWIGINTMLAITRNADEHEEHGERVPRLASMMLRRFVD